MTLPFGWRSTGLPAEQPTTTYADFKREILNEAARALLVPYNVAAGKSAGYNYSSGRLDHLTYHKSIHVERVDMETCVLEPILRAWFHEPVLIEGLLPQSLRRRRLGRQRA